MASDEINIKTVDEKIRVTGVAKVKEGDTVRVLTDAEITSIHLIIEQPNGTLKSGGPFLCTLTGPTDSGNFHYDTTGAFFSTKGVWTIVSRYTLADSKKLHSDEKTFTVREIPT